MDINQSGTGIPQADVPLQLAFEQSEEIKTKVTACADEIGVANAAVEAAITRGATLLSARKALAVGTDVGGKVQQCADDLHEVTDNLAKGIEDQRLIETELVATREALAQAQTALAQARDAEQEANLKALHDAATGLPNRQLFNARLEQAIAMADRHGWTLAVMFFDLDRFKSINDAHGHAIGDAVLQEVADRLSAHVRAEDTICRNGGDEFLYLLVNPQARQNIEHIATSVLERVGQQISTSSALLAVKASIGIAVYPDDADSAEQLVRSADAAMYLAKHRKSAFAFADELAASDAA